MTTTFTTPMPPPPPTTNPSTHMTPSPMAMTFSPSHHHAPLLGLVDASQHSSVCSNMPVLDARVGLGGRGLRGGGWGRGRGRHGRGRSRNHDGGGLLAGEGKEKVCGEREDLGPEMVLSGLEGDERDGAAAGDAEGVRRWWGGAALGWRLWRAGCEVVFVCLGYFLMIAVMTMNTGYFISVLSGVFLGMFLLGGTIENSAGGPWHQC
ncbi:predicted protein [Chaetomium globosum CBS 148.51]|uniref:Copper transport protein n=1 Tax=Chaetomium globosum (strain ATCC 6205 / CBS 148.51 / DSM 1962 / NBRC 6347 / NRRL 1970) TaxID=306901 RepID=Q2H021_CHAGB|nr:uncharacterized protein CHGG_04875 [Chaetomium globosum CBS 148.51]EAQ88256.1 predicted protein [Chaetomium globosum CBS 148.51]